MGRRRSVLSPSSSSSDAHHTAWRHQLTSQLKARLNLAINSLICRCESKLHARDATFHLFVSTNCKLQTAARRKTLRPTPPHSTRPSTQSVRVSFSGARRAVDAYGDVALTILDGDAGPLLALAGKLPDEAKKTELLAFHERRTRREQRQQRAEAPQRPSRRARGRGGVHRATPGPVASLGARWRASIASDSNASGDPAIGPRKPTTSTTNVRRPPTTPTSSNDVMRELSPTRTTRTLPRLPRRSRHRAVRPVLARAVRRGLDCRRLTTTSFYAVAKNGASATATTCPMCRAPIAGSRARLASTRRGGTRERAVGGAAGGPPSGVGVVEDAKRKESRGATSSTHSGRGERAEFFAPPATTGSDRRITARTATRGRPKNSLK